MKKIVATLFVAVVALTGVAASAGSASAGVDTSWGRG